MLRQAVFGGRFDEKKVAPHVGDADGCAIDNESHLRLGGMRAVILFRYHGWSLFAGRFSQ